MNFLNVVWHAKMLLCVLLHEFETNKSLLFFSLFFSFFYVSVFVEDFLLFSSEIHRFFSLAHIHAFSTAVGGGGGREGGIEYDLRNHQ